MPRKAAGTDEKNKKSVRFDEILNIISTEEIETQDELRLKLNERGFNVTQCTVSRDIRELKLVKSASQNGGYFYKVPKKQEATPASSHFNSLFTTVVVNIDSALNQVVIKTYSGMANAVCVAMDDLEWDNVIGTIAGDDTILIVTKSEAAAKELVYTLNQLK
ncbi:MAG: arginine repressor [Clostridia bacterium]|nr:arginine repressor [Clostridia bacterium]